MTGVDEADGVLDDALIDASERADAGDEAGALEALLELELEHPDSAPLFCLIGVLAVRQGADGMAVDYFRRCLELGPDDVEVLLAAGAGLDALADPGAEPALRSASILAPDRAEARMRFGSFLARQGLLEQGITELEVARGLEPANASVRKELGIALLLAGRAAEAGHELETAAAEDPEDIDARLLWGLALLEVEELSAAAEVLHPLSSVAVDDGEIQLLVALVSGLEGWEGAAWEGLSRAEAVGESLDPGLLQETEEALESGEDAIRNLLQGYLAPMILRDRIHRG